MEQTTDHPADRFGDKCGRLLLLAAEPAFQAVTLPVFPLGMSDTTAIAANHPDLSRDASYPALVAAHASRLRNQRPSLAAEVRLACGPPPWIVRSSGAEDTADNVNAGGYESTRCYRETELPDVVASVVWSGYTQRALTQARLVDPNHRPGPVPVFVQPLLTASPSARFAPATDELPLLAPALVDQISGWLSRLHQHLDFERLDCEWVAVTDAGTVSITSLTKIGIGPGPAGQLSLAFGFASAQRVAARDTSTAWLAGDGTVLWHGALLRQVEVSDVRLVQARPAPAFDPLPDVETLTAASRQVWQEACLVVEAEFVIAPKRLAAAALLTATTLDEAWLRYLQLGAAERRQVGHVFVERGSAAEHAGVMFRQSGITVLRASLADLPAWATYCLADPWSRTCFFGLGEAPQAETELRRMADIPPGARLLFDRADCAPAAAAVAAGVPVSDTLMPGAKALKLVPGLSPADRRRILDQSLLPSPLYFRSVGEHAGVLGAGRVASPSFVAVLAECLLEQGMPAEQILRRLPALALPYLRVLLAAHGVLAPTAAFTHPAGSDRVKRPEPPTAAESELAGLEPERASEPASASELAGLVAMADLRPAVLLAELAQGDGLGDDVFRQLVSTVWAAHQAAGSWAATALVTSVHRVARTLREFYVYSADDRDAILLRVLAALAAAPPERVEELSRLVASSSMPPQELPGWLAYAVEDEAFLAGYLRLHEHRRAFAAAGGGRDAPDLARLLNRASQEFASGGWFVAHTMPLLDLIRCDTIEVYDAELKRLLMRLVDGADVVTYRRYLDVMSAWLDWARDLGLTPDERRATAVFDAWLASWRVAQPPADYTIHEFVDPVLALAQAARQAAGRVAPPSPHALHNLLHQWLLARTPRYPVERATSRLAELHRFADTFCRGGNKLLRHTATSVEIEIPLSIHKAGFLFRPDRIEVEWSEQPGVADDEIGRLLVFEHLLTCFGNWHPDLVFRAVRLLLAGSWTMRVEVRPTDGSHLTYAQAQLVLGLLRTMFDSSYDFSYISNNEVDSLPAALQEPGWRDLFTALVQYRWQFDDTAQYETVETMPLAAVLAAVCLEPHTRAEVLMAVQSEPGELFDGLDNLSRELTVENSPEQWNTLFCRLQLVALVAAARWPEESLTRLEHDPSVGWADVLAASLFRRRDIQDRVGAAWSARPPSLSGITGLVLRHYPAALVRPETIGSLVALLLTRPRAFRRCKQYVVHRYADVLEPAHLAGLIDDLDVIPEGFSARAETAISAVLIATPEKFRTAIRADVRESSTARPR